MPKVSSSHIDEIEHTGDTLRIKFHNGGWYTYRGVPASKYDDLLNASSVGKHFAQHIKPHHKHSRG